MATNVPQVGAPSLSVVPNSGIPNPLYGATLATVILCCSLTTIFTAARLVTKYLTAKFGVEDCKSYQRSECANRCADTRTSLDLLFVAWVGDPAVATHRTEGFG